MKAAYYKKHKLAQNLKAIDPDKKEREYSDLSASKDQEDISPTKKNKMKFGELFKTEGMYHSINEEMRRSFTLVKSPGRDVEKHIIEEEMKNLEFEERYNENIFDSEAIKKIEFNNLRRKNPHDPKVLQLLKEEK
jgi:hypothetical protein